MHYAEFYASYYSDYYMPKFGAEVYQLMKEH